jgi:multidrug resistance efflux pump
LGAARSKHNRYQSVAKEGALSKNQLEEAQLAVDQQSSAVEAQKAVIEGQKQTIERLQQAIVAALARQRGAMAALNPSNAEVAIASGGDKRPKTKTNNGIEGFSPRGKNPELIDNILF